MSLRPAARRERAADDAVIAAVRSAEPVVVVDRLDLDRALCVRAVREAVERLPEVIAARAWAGSDVDRKARVCFAVAGLASRSYAASEDALERDRIPF